MLSVLLPTPTPGRAAAILREVFGGLPGAFAFRLWDGQEVRLGFLSLIRDPTPYNFAECYVQSRLDLEGDLFQAMDVANAVEGIEVTPLQKLRLLLSLWKR
jgi:hypothetical protein